MNLEFESSDGYIILSLPYYREEKDKATQIYSHLSIQHLRTSSDNMMP